MSTSSTSGASVPRRNGANVGFAAIAASVAGSAQRSAVTVDSSTAAGLPAHVPEAR